MSTYDMETTIQLPSEEDVDVRIEFEVSSWGYGGSGPSLHHPGDPPEPPEFYIVKVERLDTDRNITDKVEALPDEWRRKIEDLVFDQICEIEADRQSYDYDG